MDKILKWKKRIRKIVNVICAIVKIVLTAVLWLCVIAIYYGAEILSWVGRILIAQLERAMQKESERIQHKLKKKQAKAILRIAKNTERRTKRGQRINEKKAKRGEPVPLRYIN